MTTRSKTKKASSTRRSPRSRTLSKSTGLAKTHAGLTFVRRFQHVLAKTKLLPRGSKIIVAVSGGPDSMTLLSLLIRLREKHDFTLQAAHVNYGLRGRDADLDEELVQRWCEEHAVPLSVLYPEIKPQHNVEAALREIRYTFFENLRRELRFDVIATGHTMNDLAETLLLNLLRGAGERGLSPFQRKHSHLARPLLWVSREAIERFMQDEAILFRTDRSNFSKRFTRNRIRHELLPLLKTFNPNIVATLAETAGILGKGRAAFLTDARD